jgi:hypothetical protein
MAILRAVRMGFIAATVITAVDVAAMAYGQPAGQLSIVFDAARPGGRFGERAS